MDGLIALAQAVTFFYFFFFFLRAIKYGVRTKNKYESVGNTLYRTGSKTRPRASCQELGLLYGHDGGHDKRDDTSSRQVDFHNFHQIDHLHPLERLSLSESTPTRYLS